MWRIGFVLIVSCLACSREAPTVPELTATPLPARAAADGTRFVRLDPATSGLAFANELRPENVVAYVYTGSGLAVADYDADGLPDVYFVSQDGSNKLFRQVAPLRFVDVTESAGGLGGGDAWGTAAAFADVDGDRDLDLYVCNLESCNQLWLNQGDGTFRESAGSFGLAATAASTGAAFADYDNDGDLDLYLLTNRVFGPLLPQEIVDGVTLPKSVQKTKEQLFPPYPTFATQDGKKVVPDGYADLFMTIGDRIFPAGQRDRLFRNDGYASWHDVTDEAGLAHHGNGLSVVWWDCDGDGKLDLYVANDLHSADKLWRNLGDGRFEDITKKALPHTAFFGMGCDFGDLDHDGRFDLWVADMSSTTHYMGKMLMGSMNVHRWFLMNADPQQYMRNALYVNSGTERFLEAAHLAGLASTDWTWSVRLADLDDDARLDAFVTNGIPVFTDDPDAGNRFNKLWEQGKKAQALELYRSLRPIAEKNIARRNVGDLKFEDVGAAWGLDESSVGQGAVVADLDRDGDLDVLVNNQNQPASVFENRTHGTHRILVELRGTASNSAGVGARIAVTAGGVTQTALVMPTRGYASAGEAVEHFGLGASTKVERLELRWPSGRTQEFVDLDADRHYVVREPEAAAAAAVVAAPPAPSPAATVFAARDDLPVRHAERDFDDYAVQPLLPHRLSRLGPGIACADVDRDGRTDVWIGGAAGQAGTLLLARADGAFAPREGPWQEHAECEDLGAVFVDYDGDGDQDLYVTSGGVEAGERTELLRDRLYQNDGKGTFAVAPDGTVPDERHSGSCVVAADFDRDGDLDLFVGSRVVPGRFPHAPASMLLRNDRGRFVDATAGLLPELQAAGMVTAAVWTDLDDDGWSDLVVAAQWQPIRVFGNREGKGFVDRTKDLGLLDVRGQWNGVAAGDLDGDGDLDLVATNLGLNTKYKASAASPQRLFARDFDGNGTLDVVEAKHQGPTMLPVRGLSCSSEAMPFLSTKFPTYDAFARANLTEIYGAEPLQQCLELTSNELRHVVLENLGGTFVLQALPRAAQVSAGYGIAIADFDGDGLTDVVLGHNSFSPEPETGRFGGGLGVLLRGPFEAVPAHASGIVMPEDSKGLCTIDLDGDASPDFLAATNDGPVRGFVARPKEPGLAVRLAGPPGNPTAVGARIQLVRANGSRQVAEIAAGSGYLGQGEAAAFFTKVATGSRLVVRWPDGHTTEHAVTAAGRMLLWP